MGDKIKEYMSKSEMELDNQRIAVAKAKRKEKAGAPDKSKNDSKKPKKKLNWAQREANAQRRAAGLPPKYKAEAIEADEIKNLLSAINDRNPTKIKSLLDCALKSKIGKALEKKKAEMEEAYEDELEKRKVSAAKAKAKGDFVKANRFEKSAKNLKQKISDRKQRRMRKPQ